MLKDSFCSSPWFHIRLSYDGSFKVCRWSTEYKTQYNIKNTSISEFYNIDEMRLLRTQLLNGEKPNGCATCYYEESFGKLNGRQRQLLKSAVTVDNFDLKLRASPHYNMFKYSLDNDGLSNYMPVDLQIDLGHICNSACVMCSPNQSTRLEKDYVKLNQIDSELFEKPMPYKSWTADPVTLDKFVNELSELPIKYIHFLGGETLYDPAFYTICDKMIAQGIAKDIIVGTTTNATIYNEKIEQYAREFKEFHLGISIETVTPLNDYIRWPSKIDGVLNIIQQFKQLHDTTNLFISLRITPNIFTISHIDTLVKYMLDNNLIAESCNILYKPSMLRVELMPVNIRNDIITKIEAIVNDYQLVKNNVINVRDRNISREAIGDIIIDYLMFLKQFEIPVDADKQRYDLVRFIKAFEKLRGNKITDYVPEYTEFLTAYGY
jgi:MoaA/NifB/PqqE/SkfB family radical SAM enzyme